MSSALAAATLGSGFLSTAGSVYTNAVNSATQQAINNQHAALQWAINADQIEAARMNNETAVNLANTAHQREVMDLRDANLNPILSANGNGSAVPALDTPGLEAPQLAAPTITNPLSGLANSLATAVQVNDNHQLNEERIKAIKADLNARGFGEGLTKDHERILGNLNRSLVYSDIHSAIAARQAQEEKANLENIRTQLEYGQLASYFGLRTRRDANGRITVTHPAKSEAIDLLREGLISDLKMRANQNMRAGINSATSIGNAASNIGSTIKSFLPRSWFKFERR